MKALIFAAGLGTRLRPLTDTMPKALVPVGGKPLLGILLEKLQACGIREVVVNVHHFPDMIRDYVLSRTDLDLDIRLSDESDLLLETGGGVLHAEALLRDGEPFLVHNVDILSNLDIPSFVGEALRGHPDAMSTLLVSGRRTSRYLLFDPGDLRLVGWTNISNGEVRSPWGDIDPGNFTKLAFSGIHLMSQGIFPSFRERGFSGRFPIMDYYVSSCRDVPIYGATVEGLRLLDVGKVDSLSEAERFLPG